MSKPIGELFVERQFSRFALFDPLPEQVIDGCTIIKVCRAADLIEAQREIDNLQSDLKDMREDLNDARHGWEQATLELDEAAICIANQAVTISQLMQIKKAAENLVKVKGRHHAELAMNRLLETLKS